MHENRSIVFFKKTSFNHGKNRCELIVYEHPVTREFSTVVRFRFPVEGFGGTIVVDCEAKAMDEKLEREVLVGEIKAYIEILNAKGIDSPLRSLEILDTMSVLDLRILSRRLRDMARTPSA